MAAGMWGVPLEACIHTVYGRRRISAPRSVSVFFILAFEYHKLVTAHYVNISERSQSIGNFLVYHCLSIGFDCDDYVRKAGIFESVQ